MDPSDQELIARCQAGDRAAFEPIFRRYRDRAHGFALAFVGSPDDAMDLAQEAFVRAFQAIKRFEPGAAFEPWFFRILRNLCLNTLRHRKTWQTVSWDVVGDVRGAGPESASGDVERKELQDLVWTALGELTPDQREIIVLKDFQDRPYKDIAEILDCPLGTVMSRLYYARQALKAKLNGRF
jgi:RNA polymerase sigma-70 factor (ECF subfamily)